MPGLAIPDQDDHGYAALAVIGDSYMAPATLVRMHLHEQDEIISWVPEGVMRHDDHTHRKLVTDPGASAGDERWAGLLARGADAGE
jgi:quercetin 2,3-dioxygenase